MDKMHFSTAECFENCPARFDFRYNQGIEVLESDDPANPLKVGTALHKGIEEDLQTALQGYFMSYPIITDEHINEAIKLEYWIPKVKELLPEGLHEVNMQSDWYEGTMDLLVPCTKHDLELEHGQFDLYDFKYSNNIGHYMESRQLHVYKHFCEQILKKRIRKMFFVFVPKVKIKQKKTETLDDFRRRLQKELQNTDETQGVQIKEVIYDPQKVIDFFETCMKIHHTKEYKKEFSYLCNWCEYSDYCQKGIDFMVLPSSERRQVGQTTKRKLWIYGGAFSGKTTFMDKAPSPLNLNTDGNVQFVTMPYLPIKDTYEGRQKVLAWQVFKDTIDELERKNNGFKTIIVDLLEDTYESCRLYMYDKLGITHESDDSFRAWDKVRTEFLSTIRRLMNLDYENIVLISHEDMSKDIAKKGGDKITAIKPNIQDKIANKIAGMVDIVARVVVEDDDSRTLNFKSNEVIFGGGRLKGISKNSIPLDWDALCQVYDEANSGRVATKVTNTSPDEEKGQEKSQDASEGDSRRTARHSEPVQEEEKSAVEPEKEAEPKEAEQPVRTRRTRKER
jgi:phage nucleotide-binding protein